MAQFFDLEEEGDDGASHPPEDPITQTLQAKTQLQSKGGKLATAPAASSHCSESIARAFQCYPIISSIVSSIDLNTLDALARSCRSVHNGLVQYRNILVTSTLHCTNEGAPVNPKELLRYRARAGNWHNMEGGRCNGKSGSCARDMVDECRKCGDVICRNCSIKPPAPVALRERHRRLCRTCIKAPVTALTIPRLDLKLPFDSDAVQQSLCKCESAGVWLCQPCGRSIRAADHEYRSIWRWRNQYGEVLGGLGTGIGDGDRGVICGRGDECLAAKDREQEVDCDAQDARDSGTAPWVNEPPVWMTTSTPSPPALAVSDSPTGSPFGPATPLGALIEEERHERTPSPQLGPGYERHEIEGIGGRVKRKLVRMVRIGACVPEWDDEKGFGGRILESEIKGCARSWCGWCWRVIPGKKDLGNDKGISFSGCGNRQCAL
ncbi:hypothetical protein NOR_06279 [Metarhizium rileyi]|uniref:Uncharacterized protein n=1 Tax=Metarhizium rileyi (strain RCEF 4871) TaxID=1649241 RepID=A0A167AXZ1_METRR|nr:hypothetical protein NOR_06279 [Metarhizium rileyi RCEF 4871]TWU79237.1 hypothetical protein ED733_009009 [Metarhizium rileyi]